MTENLAGRGEGLAGLEAKALAEFTAYFVENYPGPDTVICKPEWHAPKIFRAAKYAMREMLAALEAAAPPSTPEHKVGWMDSMDFDHELGEAPFNTVSRDEATCRKQHPCIATSEADPQDSYNCRPVRVYVFDADAYDAALATPSPQAPQEQSNSFFTTFSTTSAREQSSATASDSLSVGYSEDSPFSVNRAALAKAQVSSNIVAPNPDCPLCFGTGSWVEGQRCACTERPLR